MAELLPPWPSFFTPPETVAAWLHAQSQANQGNQEVQRLLITLRWLVVSELDRSSPPAPLKEIPPCPLVE